MPATATELSVTEYCAASALLAAGAQLLRATPGKRVSLIFDDADGTASRLLAQHRDGTLSLPTIQFSSALSEVKTRIFATRD